MGNTFGHNVTIGESKFGKGLFASSNISKGTEIFTVTGKPLSFTDAINLGSNECYALQIGVDKYIFPDSPFAFVNHSCNPNCGINSNLELVAIKDINIGDEIYFDYSTSMLERSWTMICDCKTANCRQIIDDFDTLPITTKEYYKSLNIVQPFILNSLDDNT